MMKPRSTPTVRSLAAELKVSAITISRALRGHPNVRPALRLKIERLAKRRGYQADPVRASVLGSLRKRSAPHYLETIAFVWTHRLSSAEDEFEGAQTQAAALGYRLEALRPWEKGLTERDVGRVLWSRGIRGVLLAPNHSSAHPRYDLDWERFSAVLIGSSLVNAGLARVRRNYFQDAKRAVETLRERGFTRPGLVLERSIHERTDRRYAAAFAQHAGHSPAAAAALTLIVDSTSPAQQQKQMFLRWLAKQSPDAVLADFGPCARWLREASSRKTPPCVSLALRDGEERAIGIRPDFQRIGREAVTILDGLLRTRQTGLHAQPVSLLVPGVWQEPATSPRQANSR